MKSDVKRLHLLFLGILTCGVFLCGCTGNAEAPPTDQETAEAEQQAEETTKPPLAPKKPATPKTPPPEVPEYSGPIYKWSVEEIALEVDVVTNSRLWVYTPERPETNLPCVFIAPAGTRLFHGIRLARSDQPEHVHYARAGMVVVAYDLNGALPNPNNWVHRLDETVKMFSDVKGGLLNAAAAIDYVEKNLPQVDTNQLYAVGHSSAGNVALLLAQREPRIDGCVAFAPAVDTERSFFHIDIAVARTMPNFPDFAEFITPKNHPEKVTCPTLLFHSLKDSVTSPEDTREFAEAVRKHNKQLVHDEDQYGSHYGSLKYGVPKAIEFIQSHSPTGRNAKSHELPN